MSQSSAEIIHGLGVLAVIGVFFLAERFNWPSSAVIAVMATAVAVSLLYELAG